MKYDLHTTFAKFATLLIVLCPLLTAALSGCSKDDGKRTPEEKERLHQLDNAIESYSPDATKMINKGMKQAKDSITYYEYYARYGKHFLLSPTPDSITPYVSSTLRFANRQEETPRINTLKAYALNTMAINDHNFRRNPDTVISRYKQAYELLCRSDAKEMMPRVCANLGDAYMFVNELPDAAHWYRRALYLVDSLALPQQEATTIYMGLSNIYLQLADYTSAHAYLDLTKKRFGQLHPAMQAYYLTTLGNYHYARKEFRQSLQAFQQLKQLLTDNGMEKNFDMYSCLVNMSDLYLNLDSLALAQQCVDRTLPFLRQVNDRIALFYANTIRMGIAVKQDDRNMAQCMLDSTADCTGISFNLRQVRNEYARRYYEKNGNYRAAYENLILDDRENDSLAHNISNMRASEIMERLTQDTLRLHHNLLMEHKNATIQQTRSLIWAIAALAAILILAFSVWVARARKRRLQDQLDIMQLKLNSARNRISPHFTFNVLNNTIVNANEREANRLLDLTRLIRANLDLSVKPHVSLREETDFVQRYIKVESQLVGDDFDFKLDIGPNVDLDKVQIPSMFLQIMTENAFVHGLKGWDGHKELTISIKHSDRTTTVAVTDNGPGFDIRSTGQRKRIGLNIITQTIAAVNGYNSSKMRFDMHNMRNAKGTVCGCRASISIPDNFRYDL